MCRIFSFRIRPLQTIHKNLNEGLLLIFSVILLGYFLVCTFGYLGTVKDRANYLNTFEKLDGEDLFVDQLSAASSFYLIIYSKNTPGFLALLSAVFLLVKLFSLKKIFGSNLFLLLYLLKFSFVIDLILLKESLALTLILLGLSFGSPRSAFICWLVSLTAHVSALSFSVMFVRARWLLLFVFSGFIAFYFSVKIGLLENHAYVDYYLSKLDGYASQPAESLVYQNPIFWAGVGIFVLALVKMIIQKGKVENISVMFICLFSIFAGLLHSLLGVVAFRFWQFSSVSELFLIGKCGIYARNLAIPMYVGVSAIFWGYSMIYLQAFLD